MTHTLLYNPSIDKLGNRRWYVNGQLHRLDGPAVEYIGGDYMWYRKGKNHRTDGPAIEYRGVAKYWYVNGVQYTEEQFRLVAFVSSRVTV